MNFFKIKIFFLCFCVNIINVSFAQNLSRAEYIKKYKDIAIEQMIMYKIPASITLAQACLESGNGNSILAVKAKNHFGIKCGGNWTGNTYIFDDDSTDCFRKYCRIKDSYIDHSFFLVSKKRYSSLFDLNITDYKAWAHGLKAAGYATNPNYAKLLIDIIENNKLYEYDYLPSDLSKKELRKLKKLERKRERIDKKREKKERRLIKKSKSS